MLVATPTSFGLRCSAPSRTSSRHVAVAAPTSFEDSVNASSALLAMNQGISRGMVVLVVPGAGRRRSNSSRRNT